VSMIATCEVSNVVETAELDGVVETCDLTIESRFIDYAAFGTISGAFGVVALDGTFYAYGIRREYNL